MLQAFVADVHLGKLARMLRILGFDVAYRNDFTKKDLQQTAMAEDRILLSRNPAFAQQEQFAFYQITHEDPLMQLKVMVEAFHLQKEMQPFTRCTLCNGILELVKKEEIVSELDKNTATFYNEFFRCTSCRHIYWKGAHYNRMLKWMKSCTCHDGKRVKLYLMAFLITLITAESSLNDQSSDL